MKVESLRAWFVRWARGNPPPVQLLPGRPPEGAAGPAPDAADSTRPSRPVRAVCCSGGGIRAAAFSLGGMQGLGRRPDSQPSWYDEVDFVTAVSGGSYIASSFAMVNESIRDDDPLPAYAPGSPEDQRLRAHTRYLVEDPRVAALGVINVLYGLLLNLVPLLAMLFVLAKLLGWGLHHAGLLTPNPSDSQWQLGHVPVVVAVVVGLFVIAIVIFSIERLHDVYAPPKAWITQLLDSWTLRVMNTAAIVALLLLGVPFALRAASSTSIDPGALGFGPQITGFFTTCLAIVALVKSSLGRFKSKLATSTGPATGGVAGWIGHQLRRLAPWAGSALALGLLVVAFLAWTSSSAFYGFRWQDVVTMAIALGLLAVWQFFTDVNRNSIHSFYRARLASAFAVRRVDHGRKAQPMPYGKPVRLDSLKKRPALVICAAVNTDEAGRVPSGRGCAPWTFSRSWTGITSGTMFDGEPGLVPDQDRDPAEEAAPGMVRTSLFSRRAGEWLVTVPGAVAVSGAAISPAMGRQTRAPLRILLGLANVRLGLWLPNPLRQTPVHPGLGLLNMMKWQAGQPGPWALLREMFGRTSLTRRWVYVTDGGHYENLGLVEALRRGATEVVVFDASGDAPDSWSAFGTAVQTARADLGVEIDLDPTKMASKAAGEGAPTLVVQGTCQYPNGVEASLWLCKLALPEVATWDVLAWAKGHPDFPHDSTAQQLYGDREFEAYRKLGELAADAALRLYAEELARVEEPEPEPAKELRIPARRRTASTPS